MESSTSLLPCHGKHELPSWSFYVLECKYPGCIYYESSTAGRDLSHLSDSMRPSKLLDTATTAKTSATNARRTLATRSVGTGDGDEDSAANRKFAAKRAANARRQQRRREVALADQMLAIEARETRAVRKTTLQVRPEQTVSAVGVADSNESSRRARTSRPLRRPARIPIVLDDSENGDDVNAAAAVSPSNVELTDHHLSASSSQSWSDSSCFKMDSPSLRCHLGLIEVLHLVVVHQPT
jgi:hypothetical protein